MARVNADISDLFFNTELPEGAKKFDAKGMFVDFDHIVMLEHAGVFIASLERLGVQTPGATELVEDFYARV